MPGPACHEDDRDEPAGLSRENIDELLLGGSQGLSVERGEQAAYFEVDLPRGIAAVGDGQAPCNRLRSGNPEFGCDRQVFEGNKIESNEVGIEATQSRLASERGRVCDRLVVFSEAQEKPHGAGAQSIGCVQANRGRFGSAEFHFPNVVVYVIGFAEACIRRNGEV